MRKLIQIYILVPTICFVCYQPPLPRSIPPPDNMSNQDANEYILRQRMKLLDSITAKTSHGQPWPLPQSIKYGRWNLTVLSDNLKIDTQSSCDTLKRGIDRYRSIIFGPADQNDENSNNLKSDDNDIPMFSLLNIELAQCEQYPSMGMDENYTLSIWHNGTGLLKANQIWGALRGLETFSQLFFTLDQKHWYIHTVEIDDYPRFAYRGILLDTSRHFIGVSTLLKNLDLMAQNKFNVFHWHIVDDHSFPYVSERFPELSAQGAFSAKHVYSRDQVKQIVEYARLRGIRVVPEFDTPGHTLSWGAQPGLLTPCYGKDGKPDGTFGPIDPSNDKNYDFLTAFFQDVFELFPDKYVHLGGDEVSFNCWSTNPSLNKFMDLQGLEKNYAKLEQYYIQQLIKYVGRSRNNTGFVVWQEVFDNGVQVKPDTVIHVWMGNDEPAYQAEMDRVTGGKLQAILSSCWYLNYISYGSDWIGYYACDPQSFNGTEAQKKLVIGGEACMWGEYVDATNVLPRLWPRASAVAERLWSNAEVKDHEAAAPRLEEQRCRLLRRGYQVESINGPGFCPYEWNY